MGSTGCQDFPPAAAESLPESTHQTKAVPYPRGAESLGVFILVQKEEQGRQELPQLIFTTVDETSQASCCRVSGEALGPNKTPLIVS